MRPVLYYVHHHGLGHWRRALAVADALTRPVIFASSTPAPREIPDTGRFLLLPDDFPAPSGTGPDAHGRLHWAPPDHQGLLERHHLLLAEAARYRPVLAVVDVSVEITVLLRTSGIPVIAVRQPGRRTDAAHELGFGLADEVVMPVPVAWGMHRGLARTRAVGLVAASGTAPTTAAPARPDAGPPRVVVLVGRGGSRLDRAQCEQLAVELPDHEVRVLGLDPGGPGPGNLTFLGHLSDPRAELAAARVVVGNTGLGTVGDVAGAGRPFVAVPEDRPFGEQQATAQALRRNRDAVVLTDLPGLGGWRQAVLLAAGRGPALLATDGAARFAQLIEERAEPGRVRPPGGIPAPARARVRP